MIPVQLDPATCRRRQQRLLEIMQQKQLDWTIIRQPEHIQYLFGPRLHWTLQSLAALRGDGFAVLVTPEHRQPERHAADEVLGYAARWHSTLRNDQCEEASRQLISVIQAHGQGHRWVQNSVA